MIHTKSSINAYAKCHRLWHWLYDVGVDIKQPPIMFQSDAMDRGSAAHRAIAHILQHGVIGGIDDEPPETRMRLDALLSARQVVENAYHYIEPIEVEKVLRGKLHWYTEHRISGRLDLIAHYKGGTWVVDHKTSMRTKGREHFAFDIQRTIYLELARQNGYDVSGYLVHFLRIPSMRKGVKEDWEQYRQRIYDDVLKVTMEGTHPQYFHFYEFPLQEERHREDVRELIHRVREIEADKYFTRNGEACADNYPCPCLGICEGAYPIKDLRRVEDVHGELL